jgi:catechol 2,3-dioxygenase-like lactoylglutathione lyase family enzyme
MNWKIRSDDGKQAVLDIGDWGGLVLRGGYQPPVLSPAGDAGGGGGRGGAGGGPRVPRLALFDGFCWGIEPWDAKKVEAELRKRGLTPVADNQGRDFQSFHVKDPDGFDLQISNGNQKNRRQGSANGRTSVPAAFEATTWKTVWLDHISFEVSNYKETVAFYTALLGWKPGTDEASQNQCGIGDVGDIIIRRGFRGNRGGGAGTMPPPARGAAIGHIAFGITPFDPDQVKAELEKRGLTARVDTGGRGDIHTASYKSYHTTTPNGFDLQISATTRASRGG